MAGNLNPLLRNAAITPGPLGKQCGPGGDPICRSGVGGECASGLTACPGSACYQPALQAFRHRGTLCCLSISRGHLFLIHAKTLLVPAAAWAVKTMGSF